VYPGGDELRAVPVEGRNLQGHDALEPPGDAECVACLGVGVGVRVPGSVPEQLQAAPVGIVDGDEGDAVVVIEVSSCDELAVPQPFDPCQVGQVDDVNEADWPPAVLHVRPASFADGGEVEAVSLG
jgi:hypothetical protein